VAKIPSSGVSASRKAGGCGHDADRASAAAAAAAAAASIAASASGSAVCGSGCTCDCSGGGRSCDSSCGGRSCWGGGADAAGRRLCGVGRHKWSSHHHDRSDQQKYKSAKNAHYLWPSINQNVFAVFRYPVSPT